jgi:succinoglycan biosynthesis protein ExoA
VAVAYRRTVFDQVGLFDENFDACEDVELNHRVDRAGLRCFFTPQIEVRYYPRASLSGIFRQLFRYGRGRVRLLRKHRDTLSLKSLLPGLLVLGSGAGVLSFWLSPNLWSMYLSCISLYLGTLLIASFILAARNRSLQIFAWLPAVFLAVHFGAGAGILWETVFPRSVCSPLQKT